jgi:hypothetical protein
MTIGRKAAAGVLAFLVAIGSVAISSTAQAGEIDAASIQHVSNPSSVTGVEVDADEFQALKATIAGDGEKLESTESVEGISTTYKYEGFELLLTEPGPGLSAPGSTMALFDIESALPYAITVILGEGDQQALAAGGYNALNVALCAIPAVGWASCGAITVGLQAAGAYLQAEGLCQGDFRIIFSLQSGDDNWISYRCDS